jgi:16S rRNA (guanine527-N7)-methyltransferase
MDSPADDGAREPDRQPVPDEALLNHHGLRQVLERARTLGFLGPGEVDEHITHALRFLGRMDHFDPTGQGPAVDLGTGAGVPGLILALARPARPWCLVDSMQRRMQVLAEAVAALDLGDRVTLWTGRAEDLSRNPTGREQYAVVVARSFGPPATLAECAAPLLTAGGVLLVSEPPGSRGERWPVASLGELGLQPTGVVDGIMALTKVHPTPDRFPRSTAKLGKRPLF